MCVSFIWKSVYKNRRGVKAGFLWMEAMESSGYIQSVRCEEVGNYFCKKCKVLHHATGYGRKYTLHEDENELELAQSGQRKRKIPVLEELCIECPVDTDYANYILSKPVAIECLVLDGERFWFSDFDFSKVASIEDLTLCYKINPFPDPSQVPLDGVHTLRFHTIYDEISAMPSKQVFPALEHVVFAWVMTPSLPALGSFGHIKRLSLNSCLRLTDVSALAELAPSLETLVMYSICALANISPLKTLRQLKTLDISHCHLLDPDQLEQVLDKLLTLEHLSITNNETLQQLRLDKLTFLRTLSIEECRGLESITVPAAQRLDSVTLVKCKLLHTIDTFTVQNCPAKVSCVECLRLRTREWPHSIATNSAAVPVIFAHAQ